MTTRNDRRKVRTLLYDLRDSVVEWKAQTFGDRQDDMDLRSILAHVEHIEIHLDRIQEREWQEQLEYEQQMGEDL